MYYLYHWYHLCNKDIEKKNWLHPHIKLGKMLYLHCKDTEQKMLNKTFPEMKLRGLVPYSYIHLPGSHFNIPKIALPILRPIVGIYKSLTDT
jgi:hypothetical protein